MENRVVVTGIGVVSPLGSTIPSLWEALIHGKSGIRRITQFDPTHFDSQIAGEVTDFDPLAFIPLKESKRMERFVQFGVAAAKMALVDSKIDLAKENIYRVGVLVGSGVGSLRMVEEQCRNYFNKGPSKISPFLVPLMIVNEAAGNISIALGVKGPNSCVATACATGTHTVGDAFRMIKHGYADVMFAGGTESCLTPMGVGGFCALKALSCRNSEPEKASRPFDKDRDGFVIAEGAGIVVLESLEHAKKRGAHIYAEVIGYGMTGDAYHITAPDPTGEAQAKTMEFAVKDAHIKPEEIQYINAHGTSTQLNDKLETKAIKMCFGAHARKVAISSTKSMTGHLIGAAGGLEFVVIALAVKNDIIPPTINLDHPDPECDLDYVPYKARHTKVNIALSNSLGFGGHNATIVVKKFQG